MKLTAISRVGTRSLGLQAQLRADLGILHYSPPVSTGSSGAFTPDAEGRSQDAGLVYRTAAEN